MEEQPQAAACCQNGREDESDGSTHVRSQWRSRSDPQSDSRRSNVPVPRVAKARRCLSRSAPTPRKAASGQLFCVRRATTSSPGSQRLEGSVHIPASNVIEGDEHLQHSAHARFGDCGWHCNGHRCHCSGDLRAWSGNLDDDLGRLSRLFRSAARAVLQPTRGDLRYNDAEPSAPRVCPPYGRPAYKSSERGEPGIRYGGDTLFGRCRRVIPAAPMSADQ